VVAAVDYNDNNAVENDVYHNDHVVSDDDGDCDDSDHENVYEDDDDETLIIMKTVMVYWWYSQMVVNTTSMLLQPNNMKTWKDLPKTNQSSTATRLLWCVESSLAILAKSINETRVFNSSAPGLSKVKT